MQHLQLNYSLSSINGLGKTTNRRNNGSLFFIFNELWYFKTCIVSLGLPKSVNPQGTEESPTPSSISTYSKTTFNESKPNEKELRGTDSLWRKPSRSFSTFRFLRRSFYFSICYRHTWRLDFEEEGALPLSVPSLYLFSFNFLSIDFACFV